MLATSVAKSRSGWLRHSLGAPCRPQLVDDVVPARLAAGLAGIRLRPVQRGDGTTDRYISREHFNGQFCADVPDAGDDADGSDAEAREAEGAVRSVLRVAPVARGPSWFVVGEHVLIIPAEVQR